MRAMIFLQCYAVSSPCALAKISLEERLDSGQSQGTSLNELPGIQVRLLRCAQPPPPTTKLNKEIRERQQLDFVTIRPISF